MSNNKPVSKKALESGKKYRLWGKKNKEGLRKIQALRDIPKFNVKVGNLGGWVESEKNLSQGGDCWVGDEAWVYGDAQVFGDAWVHGDAQVYGSARVSGNAWVYGSAWVSGNARVYGSAWVSKDAWEVSPLYIQGTKHSVTTSSFNTLTIGCETHTVEEWLANYREIGKANGYSKQEIEEYFDHITYSAKRLDQIKKN